MSDKEHISNEMQAHAQANEQAQEEEGEAFTLVTRRKNGRKTAPANAAHPRATNIDSISSNFIVTPSPSLPGWSNPKGSGKKKKASSRAQKYAPVEKTVDWGLDTIKERRSTLTGSKFFTAFRDFMMLRLSPPCSINSEKRTPHEPKDPSQDESIGDADSTNSPTRAYRPKAIHGMVCYGIGSIEGSRNAQFQLSLALELKDMLEIKSKLCIFDPVMTNLDKEIARAFDMHVLEKDEDLPEGPADGVILYFMPHCPKGLYSHILEKNWTRQGLDRTIILGNRFSMYHESPSYRTIAKQAPYIFPALAIADEHALPAVKFEENSAFNDLAIHIFPAHHKLSDPDVSQREIDPEML